MNWNTKEYLYNCLQSIVVETGGLNYELIVIDNASTDGSSEMVRNKFPQAILLENDENKGFSAANNQGMARAQGRYILLINSDTVVLDNPIAKTVSFIEAHSEAAVVGPRVLNSDQTLQPSCFMFPSLLNMFLSMTYLYKLFSRSRFFGREKMTWWDRNDVREVDVVTGCFMLVRHEAIKEVGLFDEQFYMYAEEVDWCYRFHQSGWKRLFYPDAQIIHYGGASAKQQGSNRALLIDSSSVKLMLKHWPLWKARLGICFMVMFYLSRLPILAVLVVLTKKKATKNLLENHWKGLKGILCWRKWTIIEPGLGKNPGRQ